MKLKVYVEIVDRKVVGIGAEANAIKDLKKPVDIKDLPEVLEMVDTLQGIFHLEIGQLELQKNIGGRWTKDALQELLRDATDAQEAFLVALAAGRYTEDGSWAPTADEICLFIKEFMRRKNGDIKIKYDTKKLRGTLSGLSRRTQNMDMPPIYIKELVEYEPPAEYRYSLIEDEDTRKMIEAELNLYELNEKYHLDEIVKRTYG